MEMETLTSTDGPTPLCGRMTKGLTVTNALMATMREDDDDMSTKITFMEFFFQRPTSRFAPSGKGGRSPEVGNLNKGYTEEDD